MFKVKCNSLEREKKTSFFWIHFKDRHKGEGSLSLCCHCLKMYSTHGCFLERNELISFTHCFRSPLTHMQSIHSFICKPNMQSWHRPTIGCPRTEVIAVCVCQCVGVFVCVCEVRSVAVLSDERECSPPPTSSYWKRWSEAKAFPTTTNWMHLHAAT